MERLKRAECVADVRDAPGCAGNVERQLVTRSRAWMPIVGERLPTVVRWQRLAILPNRDRKRESRWVSLASRGPLDRSVVTPYCCDSLHRPG